MRKIDKQKSDYVNENLDLFTAAYLEYLNKVHKRTKHAKDNNFTKFVTKAREDFGYSKKTGATDIWVRFVLSAHDVTTRIIQRRNIERLKLRSVQRALGYIETKK